MEDHGLVSGHDFSRAALEDLVAGFSRCMLRAGAEARITARSFGTTKVVP